MILRPGLVVPLSLLVAMLTSSVTLYVGVADAPGAFFGDADFILLLPPGELVPGQGSIDASLVAPLSAHPSVARLSAEVYAPTLVEGRSTLVRGVHFPDLLAIESNARVEGRTPERAGEALAGADLARATPIAIGDEIVVPGSKSNAVVTLRIVGLLHASSPVRDEILAPLASARVLVDLPPDRIHVVRIDPADRAEVLALVRGSGPQFSYSNVTLSTDAPLPGELVAIRANLTNWGLTRATSSAIVRGDENVLATRSFDVPARSTRAIEISFRVPLEGVSNITINPTFEVRTREPALRFEGANVGELGAPFAFRLARENGSPAAGVRVEAGASATTTDDAGNGTIVPRETGALQLKAILDGETVGIADVFVAERGTEGRPMARILGAVAQGRNGFVRANETIRLSVQIQNVGAAAGTLEVPILLDGARIDAVRAELAPGAERVVVVDLPALQPGTRTLRIGPTTLRLSAIDGDPAIEALLVTYDAAVHAATSSDIGEAHGDYIDQVIGNVRVAIVALSIATGALATTAAVAVLARHLGERAPVIGVLKALGASDAQVQERAAREALALGAASAGAGVAAGALVALLIERAHALHAFGHEIHPRFPWHILGLIFLLSTLFVTLATRQHVAALLRHAPDALMRGERARAGAGAAFPAGP